MAIYMQTTPPIQGGVSQSHHPNWVALKYCEFPCERPGVNTTPGKVVDRLRSAVDFPDITLRKDSDSASGDLMQWIINGETKAVTIHFCKEKGELILELKLTNVLVTSLRSTVNEDQQPEEEIKLDFTKIEMKFQSYDAANKPGRVTTKIYDLATASASV